MERGSLMGRFERAAGLLVLIGVPVLVVGCTGTASGRLTSLTMKTPIAGAAIQSDAGTATTDATGAFTIGGARLGALPVTVTVPGFPPFRASINAANSDSAKASEIVLQDAALTGRLTERAAEPKVVASATVQVAGRPATLSPDGTFTLAGLPAGATSITVQAPGHEATEVAPVLRPGSNDATVAVSLTPVETYARFFAAIQFHRLPAAYSYFHPDERRRIPFSHFTKGESGFEQQSIKFGEVKMLAAWVSPVTKKRYQNVASIDRTIVSQVSDPKYSDFGRVYTENYTQCWAKSDGIWYILHKGVF